MTRPAALLCVGIATLDIINTVASYPPEDAELRAESQVRRVGGNAANTARVLARLGHPVTWAGQLTGAPESRQVEAELQAAGVRCAANFVADGRLPTSYITLARDSGSRTIVHYRDLPEYPAAAFARLPLEDFDWVHFEGRAVDQLQAMLEALRARADTPVSLEVEKPRPGIEALFGRADLLMFSRDYVRARGGQDPVAFLAALPVACMATCTWGAAGVWWRDRDGVVRHQSAFVPGRVVDTLGAGDVFNAGLLHGLADGQAPEAAVARAVRLAGEHCGREGGF